MNIRRAFTLIELLVVIAIIGILSAAVLVSLNIARDKGKDAAVKANIDNVRSQAALYHNENENYGINVLDESSCSANLFADPTVIAQVTAADVANGVGAVACNVAAGGAAYAVSAELLATPGTYYCVDSTGAATTGATALGVATVCP